MKMTRGPEDAHRTRSDPHSDLSITDSVLETSKGEL